MDQTPPLIFGGLAKNPSMILWVVRVAWVHWSLKVLDLLICLGSVDHQIDAISASIYPYPPTPALAKAGATPGTTAGVELVFLSFKCLNASRQLRSACRLPPQPSPVRALHAQPRTQKPHGRINGFLPVKQATPRPHQWLLLGGPACRYTLQTLQTLKHPLGMPKIPQPTGTPRRHQWLLLGVQACRLPALKRLKGLKGLKPLKLQKVLGTPNRAGKSYPKATSMASSQRPSLPFARRYTLQTLQTLKHPLGMPKIPQPTGTPRPHQWLLMGSLPFARPSTLERLKTLKTLQTLLGTPNRAGKSYPKATSVASSARSSLPFARRYVTGFKPFKRLNILLACLLPQPTDTPRRHQ